MHHELLCIVCRNIWVTHTLKHIRTHCVYIKNVFFKLRVWIFFKIESFCVQGQVFFLNSPIFLDYSLFSDCLLTHDIVSKLGSWVEIGNFCLWTESFSASNTCCQLCVCAGEWLLGISENNVSTAKITVAWFLCNAFVISKIYSFFTLQAWIAESSYNKFHNVYLL